MRVLTADTIIRVRASRPVPKKKPLTADTRIRLSQIVDLAAWVEDRKKAKPGEVRTWSDGDYRKNEDGSWTPVDKEKTERLQAKREIVNKIKSLPPVNVSANKTMDKKQAEDHLRKLGEVTNKRDGRVVTFPVTSAGKIVHHKGIDYSRIIESLKPLFENAIKGDTRKEEQRENHKVHPNVENYHDYQTKRASLELPREMFLPFIIQPMTP